MDRFYRPPTSSGHDFDHPSALDWSRLGHVLLELQQKGQATVPIYSMQEQREVAQEVLSAKDWLVLDGIWSLGWWGNELRREVQRIPSISVWVDTPLDIALIRRLRRDVIARGYTYEGALDYYLQHVRPGYERWVKGRREEAEIIVPDSGLDDLKQRLQSRTQPSALAYELRAHFRQL
jgi:uridine kinase